MVLPPSCHARCTLGKPSERGVILAVSLACDDGLVGNGFVGVAREGARDCERMLMSSHVQTCPAIVLFPMDAERQSEIAALYIEPIAKITIVTTKAELLRQSGITCRTLPGNLGSGF